MDVYKSDPSMRSPLSDAGGGQSDNEKDKEELHGNENVSPSPHSREADEGAALAPNTGTISKSPSHSAIPVHNFQNISSHNNLEVNGHPQLSSKSSSVYDFNDSNSLSEDSHSELPPLRSIPAALNANKERIRRDSLENSVDNSREALRSPNFSNHNNQSEPLPHLNNHQSYGSNAIQSINSQRLECSNDSANPPLSMDIENPPYNSNNDPYDDSLSVVSEYSSSGGGNCYDGVNIIRRARGRPKGSKNGTGMGRGKGKTFKYNRLPPEDRSSPCPSYDLRNIPDPFACHRRGRPRSRFIVDLGEQNHEAWTKAKEDLAISDAELTTLLLSLLESKKDCKEPEDSETILSLTSSEFKKWKEKFASQLSMLTHYASIHNTTCCTCLGIKKKKYIPAGTGKRGRPRKYPPPVGYGPGMQRPDTIDEDGNIFEPQIILKDGMVVKNEPNESTLANSHMSNVQEQSSSMNGDPFSQYSARPLTQEEIEKRREYYNNHKNKIKYVCHFCQIHFYHKPNFDYHISKLESTGKCKIMDKVNNLYLCESCGEGFSWREKLEKHLRLADQHGTHNQKELLMYGDFQCNMCGKTFNKRTTYLQHIKWHEEREDIPCVICGTMFKQTELRNHLMDVHSNDSLPCSYCGKLFTSRKYLEKHELIHQGGNFPCPECGKIFTQKNNMQEHLRGHALDKEYPCETCGQMLNQRIGLCHHLKKHFAPDEFSYECDICAHYFANEYLLKYHKNKVHNIVLDGIADDLSDQPEYLSSPISSHLSGDEEREKVYGAVNNAAKNMLEVSLGNTLERSVNLTMKHEGENESIDDGQSSLRDAVHMNEHMRHMRETPTHMDAAEDHMRMVEQQSNMAINEDHLHMPQDLTRMTANQHMNDERMSHMNDLRPAVNDSPGRLSDTPGHMDNLGRMSAENFGRMAQTTGGYLAEHIRRMAENQSRMSDSMSVYDDRDNYSRLGENLRSMSRGSAGDPMGRLGENLSHMGVIRPSQTTSSTSQWPAHMQNHSTLEGMNQSPQTSQHALYPLPFWPYDPSLRQYHH